MKIVNMAIIRILTLVKLLSSGLFLLPFVKCSAILNHFDDHPVLTVFRQFLEERKHSRQSGTFGTGYNYTQACHVPPDMKKDIEGYTETVRKIMETVINGTFKGTSHKALGLFADLFPNRFPGSDAQDDAITYLESQMDQVGFTNIWEEESHTILWSRGIEMAWITNPTEIPLNIRGMSLTVETPEEGIEALVLVVKSFEDLDLHHEDDEVNGTIVLFNPSTGDEHKYLFLGPTVAAKYGALAVMCRSPTKLIYNSVVLYEANVTKIPAVVISREDADTLERLIFKEDEIYVFLKLIGQNESNVTSRNIIGDYRSVDPMHKNQKLMLVSHVGSLDAGGDGVQDDGLGIIMALQLINVLNYLGLKPKRTIRTAVFSGEETGMKGATEWVKVHRKELFNYTAVLEANMGCSQVAGFFVSGSSEMACVMWEIMRLFKNQTDSKLLARMEAIPSHVMPIHGAGVPWIGLIGDNNRSAYWNTKKSRMDGMAMLDPDEVDKCLAVMTSVAYVLADMPKMLPRRG